MTPEVMERTTDSELWQLVRQEKTEAFEEIVRRHQSLICAVAYNFCGNQALSEDVAQETFWTAWRERFSLDQPARLQSWLCGIARNQGKNASRKASRPAEAACRLEDATEPIRHDLDPADEASSREEEAIVWRTLEQIPETYREPLILFYREDQSVADVAAALEISEDAAKQRLSRGRAMIREQLAELVEHQLRRSKPGRSFTVAVMSGLAASTAGAKTAIAAGAGGAAKAAGLGLGSGVLSGLLGGVFGIGGGWLGGAWLPTQLARTQRERELFRSFGRRMLLVSLIFVIGITTPFWPYISRSAAMAIMFITILGFQAFIFWGSFHLSREVKRIRSMVDPSDVFNDSPLRIGLDRLESRYRGRVYRSKATLLGLPLLDINVRDPHTSAPPEAPAEPLKVARGWIAIGDDAVGVLLAVASRNAVGLIAMGGRALGGISLGGIAVGLISFGGLAVGFVSFGGLALGAITIGGGAIGWQACGGGAIAWDVACGGLAIARHAAIGGLAIARDFAVGGGGSAAHFNDADAKALLLNHPFKLGMDWYIAHQFVTNTVFILSVILSLVAMLAVRYRPVSRTGD